MSISINKFTSWYNKAVPPRKFVAVVHRIGEHVIEDYEKFIYDELESYRFHLRLKLSTVRGNDRYKYRFVKHPDDESSEPVYLMCMPRGSQKITPLHLRDDNVLFEVVEPAALRGVRFRVNTVAQAPRKMSVSVIELAISSSF